MTQATGMPTNQENRIFDLVDRASGIRVKLDFSWPKVREDATKELAKWMGVETDQVVAFMVRPLAEGKTTGFANEKVANAHVKTAEVYRKVRNFNTPEKFLHWHGQIKATY